MKPRQSRRQRTTPWFIFAVTVGSITLVRLPVLLEHKGLIDPVIVGIFVLSIAWTLQHEPRGSFAAKALLVPLLYALVVCVALVRGGIDHAYGSPSAAVYQSALYGLFLIFGATLITSARTRRQRTERLIAIGLAPVAYVTINAVLNLGGVQNSLPAGFTQGTSATLLSSLGLAIGRTRFPLATSINLFAIVAGAALVSVVALRFRPRPRLSRSVTAIAIAACLYCLLISDSRTVLLVSAFAIALVLLRVRIPAAAVAGLIPLLPILVLGLIGLVADLHLASALSRGSIETQQFATATGRLFIWQESWDFLKHFKIQELYGWGAAGHYASGASFHYAPILSSSPEAPKELFTHNDALQMVFDTGYLGLGVLVFAIWTTWRRLQRELDLDYNSPVLALMGMIIVIVISGATEVSPTYYTQEALLELLLVMGAAAGLAAARRTLDPDEVGQRLPLSPSVPDVRQPSIPSPSHALTPRG
jgi:hypothetical protein